MVGVIGAFGVILAMRTPEGMVEEVDDLSGLSQTRPGLAWSMTGIMFSIGGLPFLVGFFGKLFIFYAAVQAGLIWLVVIAALASVVAAAYYLRIVRVIWFNEPAHKFVTAPTPVGLVANLSGLATVLLVPLAAIVFMWARGASIGLI